MRGSDNSENTQSPDNHWTCVSSTVLQVISCVWEMSVMQCVVQLCNVWQCAAMLYCAFLTHFGV